MMRFAHISAILYIIQSKSVADELESRRSRCSIPDQFCSIICQTFGITHVFASDHYSGIVWARYSYHKRKLEGFS